MVRVGRDGCDELLLEPHARAMDFTGRPMKGGLRHATSLPEKAPPGRRR
jgi:hypothetical protein